MFEDPDELRAEGYKRGHAEGYVAGLTYMLLAHVRLGLTSPPDFQLILQHLGVQGDDEIRKQVVEQFHEMMACMDYDDDVGPTTKEF